MIFFLSLWFFGLVFLVWGISKTRSLGLPGPPIFPILGSFPALYWKYKHQSLLWYQDSVKKYGSVFHVVGILGTKRGIIVSDPEMIKYFLMTNANNYERRAPVERFNQLFGQGIFNSRGTLWKTQRKTARPFFKKSSFESHIPIIQKYTKDILKSGFRDIQRIFYKLTLDIICDIGFGVILKDSDNGEKFNTDFNVAQAIVELNIRNPLYEFRSDARFDYRLECINNFIKDVIIKRADSEKSNLLNLFQETHGDNEEYMRDTVLNFIIAGRDTTATLLTWTMYCLAKNPSVEARLLKEISTISRPLTNNSIKKCKYLRWVLDEVLRLYPPIPVDTRRSISKDKIPGIDTNIPKETFLVYSAWIMGRHPDYWDEPLKFLPERWESGNEPSHKYAFVPFHGGPQLCMGRNLAYLEASVILIELLQRFRFELDPDIPVLPRKNIVLTAKSGIWGILTPI